MKFLIVTNAPTLQEKHKYVAYSPYVTEIDIWTKYVTKYKIASPNTYTQKLLKQEFKKQPELVILPSLEYKSIKHVCYSLYKTPQILFALYKAMKWADHIHLRCPGNIGLLGCLVQIAFPSKIKTAKYAGNWDPKAKQPISYVIQKKILSNTFLTKNMTVLVYGKWKKQTKNIKPFFTASFREEDKIEPKLKAYTKHIKFIFVGSLVKGKRPLFAIQIIEKLKRKGYKISLDIYGDGVLRTALQDYCNAKKLQDQVVLHGNVKANEIKEALKHTHFCILASKSEGWPKAIAEAMFFGVIPIATPVSCVPDMLNYGKRGILIPSKLDEAVSKIEVALKNEKLLQEIAFNAAHWSQNYTLNTFEKEISELLAKK